VANAIGVGGNITASRTLIPDIRPSNVTKIYATSDFTSGKNPATNKEYLPSWRPSLAAKTIGGRQAFIGTITAQPAFENITALSVLGCGDVEQHRDRHGPVSDLWRRKVDIYSQSSNYAQTREHLFDRCLRWSWQPCWNALAGDV
jgi:hypothetical protein